MSDKHGNSALISRITALIIFSALMLINSFAMAGEEVNLYSARKEALIKPIVDKFSERKPVLRLT